MENDKKYEDLKRVCLGQVEQIVHLRLDVLALLNCLIEKGVISKGDLEAAIAKTHAESKKALAPFEKASRDKQN